MSRQPPTRTPAHFSKVLTMSVISAFAPSLAVAIEGANADMTDIVKTLEKWAGVRVGG